MQCTYTETSNSYMTLHGILSLLLVKDLLSADPKKATKVCNDKCGYKWLHDCLKVHSSEIRGLCLLKLYMDQGPGKKSKVARNAKREKNNLGFLIFQKFGQVWNISLDNFIKHNPLISDEWTCIFKSSKFKILILYFTGVFRYQSK